MSLSVQELADRFTRLLQPVAPPPAAEVLPSLTDGAAPAPAVTAPPAPVRIADFAKQGVHLEVTTRPGEVVVAAALMDEAGYAIDAVTGVDWIAQDQMEVVYDYFHPLTGERVAVRTRVPRGEPELPTISPLFPGANWHERETHEFFGIRFAGHPNLTPLLLPEDATFHPLRKDFVA
ncbi:MAG: NADH-quinone oxidoreductase subunit C [Limisphaerales bacterium]